MRAGDAFWNGRADALQRHLDKHMPPCINPATHLRAAAANDGRSWGGIGFRESVIQDWVSKFKPYKEAWSTGMEADIAASESADRAAQSVQRLDAELKKFREQVRNDLSSMKAASERVQSEVTQMSQKYSAARDLLTSPAFERAIANAERMAVALKAISDLSDTKLSVAVFSGGKGA